ncbi:MAG: response regulator [bacterium]
MARVVIVDDNPEWRAEVRAAVSQAGHEVVAEAADGLEALEIVKALQPDVVTLDIQMPRMNGVECLAELQQAENPARVVMVTSVRSSAIQEHCQKLGAAGFVRKPFEAAELGLAIEEALR